MPIDQPGWLSYAEGLLNAPVLPEPVHMHELLAPVVQGKAWILHRLGQTGITTPGVAMAATAGLQDGIHR